MTWAEAGSCIELEISMYHGGSSDSLKHLSFCNNCVTFGMEDMFKKPSVNKMELSMPCDEDPVLKQQYSLIIHCKRRKRQKRDKDNLEKGSRATFTQASNS